MKDKRRFFNIHVLISHTPSCLNRDDMNMQKSAVFGGVRRVRISSQSLKRAMRKSDLYRDRIGEPSVRTIKLEHLAAKYAEELDGRYDHDLVYKTMALIAGKSEIDKDGTMSAVAPWSIGEVAHLCDIVKAAGSGEPDEKKLKKEIEKQSKPLKDAMSDSLDIALFGRMATSGLMTPVDGSMAVAHAITTHSVDSDVDWFTAVDDLTVEEGETGAGHLNTQEFGAGVFYRYASLNLPQLAENMGEPSEEKTLEIAANLTDLMARVVPTAKQQSFAAYNLADLVLVSFSDIPVSYANAFEKPVDRDNKGGFIAPSVEALESYAKKVVDGYDLDERSAAFSLQKTSLEPIFGKMGELENWIKKGGGQ
ncbi:MAG: type I-E CRISPR-associated protein Cas7/Cse4/CasC [Polyangia bacterium]